MSEPKLLQRQREILRPFRQATARRAEAEADAEARRKAEHEAADAALNQVRQTAPAQLAEVRRALEQAQTSLAQADLQRLLEQTRPAQPALRPGAEPVQELVSCVSIATEALNGIQTGIEALQLQQERQRAAASRRLLLITCGVVLFLLPACCVLLSYMSNR